MKGHRRTGEGRTKQREKRKVSTGRASALRGVPTSFSSPSFSAVSLGEPKKSSFLLNCFEYDFCQEYRSGLPFPSPGDHPKPRIEPRSLTLQANSHCLSYQGSPRMLERSLKNNPLKIHFQELKAFSEETHEKSEIRA